MLSNHLILCLFLLLLSSIFPSIRVFPNELVLHIRWPKYWCFSFNISPSNEYSGLVSFRIDWFDLLEVQGTLNTTIQKHQFFSPQPCLDSNRPEKIYVPEDQKEVKMENTKIQKLLLGYLICVFK